MRINLINNIAKNYSCCKNSNNYKEQNEISFRQTTPIKSKYDVLLEKRKAVFDSITSINSEIAKVQNYNEQRAESDTRKSIDTEIKNSSTKNIFGIYTISPEKSDRIENYYWEKFYAERDTVRYLKTKLIDMRKIKEQLEEYLAIIDSQIGSYKKGDSQQQLQNNTTYVPLPATIIQKTNSLEHKSPTLQEYTELSKEFEELKKLDVSDPKRKAVAQKLNALEKQMIEQNISFVPKAPESFASEEEKWKFINRALWETQRNEASTMDALDVFEKYGEKIYQAEPYIDTLSDLGASVSAFLSKNQDNPEAFNRVFQKYIDVYSKFATTEVKKGYLPDSRDLVAMFKHYSLSIDKTTTVKLINNLKNLAVDKDDYIELRIFFKNFACGKYSLMPNLKETDLPEIQKSLDEFAVAVANLPDDIMKVN